MNEWKFQQYIIIIIINLSLLKKRINFRLDFWYNCGSGRTSKNLAYYYFLHESINIVNIYTGYINWKWGAENLRESV